MVQMTKNLSIMGGICHSSRFVWSEQVWTRISCSHSPSSLTVHYSYRMKFFVRDHLATLFHNCSLLDFVPLEALKGLSTQRVWHSESQCGDKSRVRGGPVLFITKSMTYTAFTRYFMWPIQKYHTCALTKLIPRGGRFSRSMCVRGCSQHEDARDVSIKLPVILESYK